MTASLRNSLLVAAALCGLLLAGAGSAAACASGDVAAALNSDFGNACVNGG
ncbi:hypothetical protein [Kitasatospora viridis]|uniref:Small secreted domain DUF320 n=1 Tax=Kitasatospora viridis TaxID=281105 RepID=A0A561UMJ5_9ACTN|nr:hypothetical protein [Kitasatospora viridis]TWG00557.1 hypothetical protein FHX73_114437 [Kitasatospora viridis]